MTQTDQAAPADIIGMTYDQLKNTLLKMQVRLDNGEAYLAFTMPALREYLDVPFEQKAGILNKYAAQLEALAKTAPDSLERDGINRACNFMKRCEKEYPSFEITKARSDAKGSSYIEPERRRRYNVGKVFGGRGPTKI